MAGGFWGTATSGIWMTTERAWPTNFTPILISLSLSFVIAHSSSVLIGRGVARRYSRRGKRPPKGWPGRVPAPKALGEVRYQAKFYDLLEGAYKITVRSATPAKPTDPISDWTLVWNAAAG